MKSILIIGMGRFGHHLAANFLEHDHDVMIVDEDEEKLADMVPYATSTRIGDCTNEEVLKSIGVRNFDVVFVCIGTNFQSSLEITSLVKELGAKRVVSKVTRDIQAKFLLRNGADEVIYPDKDIAEKWKPDIVITSSTYPLDTYAGQRIRKFAGGRTKLIHEIHDMWPVSPMELGGMSKYHPFIVMMQMAENSFCRYSDKIVSLLPAAKDYLVCHGMSAKKFHHISNGIVASEWKERKELPGEYAKTLRQWKEEGGFVICFFGSHTKSYALSYLIDAIKDMNDWKVKAILVGDGIEKNKLMRQARSMKKQIKFFPPIRKEYIPALLAQVDLLYIGELDNGILRFGICMNKIFDSMMSGKPILYAVNAPNNYIEDYHCGITVEPENTAALQEGIRKVMSMSAEQREEMGKNGRKAAIENFSYEVLAEKFLKVMRE